MSAYFKQHSWYLTVYIYIYIHHHATPLQLLHTFEVAPLRCPMFCRGTTTTEGLEVCFLGIRKGEGLMKRQWNNNKKKGQALQGQRAMLPWPWLCVSLIKKGGLTVTDLSRKLTAQWEDSKKKKKGRPLILLQLVPLEIHHPTDPAIITSASGHLARNIPIWTIGTPRKMVRFRFTLSILLSPQ